IYSLAVLLAHFLSVVLVAVDIWSRPGLASTRLVKTADYFIKVSITTTAILTHILKKRNIDKLLARLDQIESLLPPRRHTWRFPNHCDVIFILVFTGTRLAFHQASTPTLYHALSGLEEFQVWVFVVTSVKFLTLLERFFSRTNDHLELLLQDDPRSIDHLYEKLYRVLELWNDLYGVQLLQLFLHIFVVLVDNIINVLTLVVSRIGHQVMENKWKASKIILNGPVELLLIRHDLRLLLMKMESWESFVSAAGYFALDYSFFLSLLAAVASYIVILLQL
ncbi:unnamed protein product, partial [Tenebrio molitor]